MTAVILANAWMAGTPWRVLIGVLLFSMAGYGAGRSDEIGGSITALQKDEGQESPLE